MNKLLVLLVGLFAVVSVFAAMNVSVSASHAPVKNAAIMSTYRVDWHHSELMYNASGVCKPLVSTQYCLFGKNWRNDTVLGYYHCDKDGVVRCYAFAQRGGNRPSGNMTNSTR